MRAYSPREYIYKYILVVACLTVIALSPACTQKLVKLPPLTPIALPDIEVKLKLVWRRSLGRGSRLQLRNQLPVEGISEVFLCDWRRIVALDLNRGKRLWRKKLDAPLSGCLGSFGDRLFVSDETGKVYAVNTENGDIVWQVQLDVNSDTPPSANENLVLVQTVNEQLIALDSNDGAPLWSYSAFNPGLSLFGSFRPLILGRVALSGFADGSIVIFDLQSGNPISFSQLAVPQGGSSIERLVDIDGTAVFENNIMYVSSYGGSTIALDLSSGKEEWRRAISSAYPAVIADGRLIVIDKDSRIHALDLESGEDLWQSEEYLFRSLSAPVRLDDYLVVGDNTGYLHVVSPTNGKTVGRKKIALKGIKNFMLTTSNGLLVVDKEGFANLVKIR